MHAFAQHHTRNKTPKPPMTLEPATGIEPALSAWEADVLPLNYAGSACNAAVRNFSTALLLYQTLAVGAGLVRECAE